MNKKLLLGLPLFIGVAVAAPTGPIPYANLDNKTIFSDPNGKISTGVSDTTTAGSISGGTWNIGGQNAMSSSGTATLPTLTAGQSFMLVTGSGATATLTPPGGVTLAGAASQSTLGPLSFLSCAFNSSSIYDCAGGTAIIMGANVPAAATAALSAAGGLSTTVAGGTSALGTSAIGSAACATVVTTSATNTATTDVIWWGFNGDPTGVTGYAPATTGMLTILPYPSANNVNFKVCNNTTASITPGAITLNWKVIR